MYPGKGNSQIFQELLDTGSQQALIPGDPQCHCGLLVTKGAYNGQVINEVLAQVCFIVGSVGPQAYL